MTMREIARRHQRPLSADEPFAIVIRGDLFRASPAQQELCLQSLAQCFGTPVLNAGHSLEVVLATYDHPDKQVVIDQLASLLPGILIIDNSMVKTPASNQVRNFLHALSAGKDSARNFLVTRADLNFKKPLPLENCATDSFCFQWNYFHNCDTREVPDQLHYIGREIADQALASLKADPDALSALPDGRGAGTLHNLYNALTAAELGQNISYLYRYELDIAAFQGPECRLRGNSELSEYNDLYSYERQPPPARPLSKRILGRIIRAFGF